jgi:hypothetical protein
VTDPRNIRNLNYQQTPQPLESGQTQAYGTLLQRLSQFDESLQQKRAQQVVAAGEIAGAAAGGQEGFEAREGTSLADESFNQAGLHAHESYLSNQIRSRIDQMADEYRFNPEKFAAAVGVGEQGPTGKGYLTEFTSKLDPRIRANLAGDITARASYHLQKLTGEARDRLADSNRAAFITDLEGFQRDIGRAARSGDQALVGAAFQGFYRALDGATGARDAEGNPTADPYVSEVQAQEYISRFEDMAIEERLLGDFERTGDKAGFLRSFQKSPDAKLRTDQVDKLERKFTAEINRQNRQARQAGAAQRAQVKANGSQVDRITTLLKAGVEIGDEQQQFLDDVLAGRIEVEGSHVEKVAMVLVGQEEAADVTRSPLAEAEAAVANLTSKKPTDLIQAAKHTAAKEALVELKSGLTGPDPTGWALQRGVGKPQEPDFSSPEGLRQSLEGMKASTGLMQETYRQPFSPFTKAQAEVFKDKLATLPARGQAAMLGVIADVYSGDTPTVRRVFSQLDKEGATLAASAGFRMAGGQVGIAKEILRGKELLATADDAALKPLLTDDEEWGAAWDSVMANVPNAVDMRARVLPVAEALLLARKTNKEKVEKGQASIGTAISDAVGGLVEVAGAPGWFGRRSQSLIAPWPGATSDEVQEWIDNLDARDIDALGGTRLGLQVGEDEVARQIRDVGEFENVDDGLAVKINGTLLRRRDGRPFVLSRRAAAGE